MVLEGLFAYVEDLDAISSYNWSKAILLFQLEGVDSLAWKLQNADSPIRGVFRILQRLFYNFNGMSSDNFLVCIIPKFSF